MSNLMHRTVRLVTAEELPNGDWLVTADGDAGLWYAAGNLSQASGAATYAAMIGETDDDACAQHGASLETYSDETGEYGTTRDARAWVIMRATELRKLG